MYCGFEFGFHHGGRVVTSVYSSCVYNNMSSATRWRGGRHRDPKDEHRRVLMEIRSKELYDTLELNEKARHLVLEAILERVVNESQDKCIDISTIAESVAPAQMLTLKRAMDTVLPLGGNNRLRETVLARYAVQLLLKTNHTPGKAITSSTRWPRSWVTPVAKNSGDRRGRACRQSQIILLTWRQKYWLWPDPDAPLANWGKYYSVYQAKVRARGGVEPRVTKPSSPVRERTCRRQPAGRTAGHGT